MKILFIGDIVAKPGRAAVKEVLPGLIKKKKIDLVIANIENLAHGKGATEKTVEEIREAGVDIMTSGNHIWFRESFADILNQDRGIIRPANYPVESPGHGFTYTNVGKQKVLIANLLGRQWMDEPTDEPYRTIDALLLDQVEKENPNIILIDYHAEATSEKAAMARFLDGRITALAGTHTHVPSADPQILPKGTAFVTDIGMSGAVNSVLGVEPDIIIRKQKDPGPEKFEWVETGPRVFRSVLITTSNDGSAKSIERLDKSLD